MKCSLSALVYNAVDPELHLGTPVVDEIVSNYPNPVSIPCG